MYFCNLQLRDFFVQMKKMRIKHEHEIIKTKLEIQEQALKNIIQEIHDNIGQILSLAKLHLGTLDFSKPEEVAQKTLTSNDLIGKAIKDLRYLARHLDAEFIGRIGLYKAVAHETGFIPRDRVSNPVLSIEGSVDDLNEREELMLFRITQELIQYFLKISQNSLLSIGFECNPDVLSIHIHEEGCEEEQDTGVDKEAFNTWLRNISDRSLLIGAMITYHNTDHFKNTLTIRFPYTKN